MTHCIIEVGQLWFRWRFVACSLPSHNLKHWWLDVNCGTNLVELEWKYNFHSIKYILKCHLQNSSHIVQGLLYWHRLILSSTWISYHLLSKVWDEVTHPFLFPYFNSFIAHIMVNVITYLYSDMNKSMPGGNIYKYQCVKGIIPGLCWQEFSDEWRCSNKCKLLN